MGVSKKEMKLGLLILSEMDSKSRSVQGYLEYSLIGGDCEALSDGSCPNATSLSLARANAIQLIDLIAKANEIMTSQLGRLNTSESKKSE